MFKFGFSIFALYLGSSARISMELSVGNSTVGSAVVVNVSVVVVAGAAVVVVMVVGVVVVDAVVAASVAGTSGVEVITSNYH